MSLKRLPFITLMLTSAWSQAVLAQVNIIEHCRVPWIFSSPLAADLPKQWKINSRHIKLEQSSRLFLQGDVRIERQGFVINSEQIYLDKEKQSLKADAFFRIQTPEVQISAKSGDFLLDKKLLNVQQLHYVVPIANGHGDAARAQYQPGLITLTDTTFSTCQDPSKAWNFMASDLTLDANSNQGTAKHLRLRIYDVPVLYFPYVSFALFGRKTGFLTPDYRYSDYQGLDISVPYYLNLAPNYDATVAPRLISNRGMQAAAEFRYLGRSFQGMSLAEYLYQDKLFEKNNRLFVQSKHTGHWQAIQYNWNYEKASDIHYFHDLGTNIGTSSRSQLSRIAQIAYRNDFISTDLRTAAYQPMEGYADTYQYLPQFNLNLFHQLSWLRTRLNSQFTRFVHKTSQDGDRYVLNPEVTLTWRGQAGFFEPQTGLRAASYSLKQQQFRSYAGYVSVDSGLFFDRFSRRGRETLEPRLFAVYAPYRQQSHLPHFDSNVIDYDYNDYFQPYRYTGSDRIADQQRVVFSLGSRYFDDESGRQTTHVIIGQNFHLNNQLTSLPGERLPQRGETQQLFRLRYQLLQRTQLELNTTTRAFKTAEKAVFALKYSQNRFKSALGYRYREQNLQTANMDALLNLGASWRLASRWVLDLEQERTQEAALGLHYRSCCWQIHLVGRYYQLADEEPRRSINVQVELSGLSNIGKLQYDIFDEKPYQF